MSRLFNRLLESTAHREERQAVEQTVREQRASLRDEGERAAACLDITPAAGAELRGRLQDEGRDAPPAGFTPKQIVQLEMYAVRHHDAGERGRAWKGSSRRPRRAATSSPEDASILIIWITVMSLLSAY